ncbi:hypothetical protein ACHAXR_010038 [Thalassiosira sp. AJA248-18]
MRQFIRKNNHSYLPSSKEYKALQAWCGTQRQLYRTKYDNSTQSNTGASTTLTDKRESLLTKIGFDWETNHEYTWHQRIHELKEYKRQYGHVNLGKKDGVLGAWADTQRTEYRYKVTDDHHSHLTEERIGELEALGFAWSMREIQWNDKHNLVLRHFTLERGGQTQTKSRLDPSLAVWLRDQKVLYRAKIRGEKNSLSPERAAKLCDLLDLETKK